MKLVQVLEAVYINAKKEDYVSKKDGKQGSSYYVSVDQDGNCGTLRCNEETYNDLMEMPRYQEVVFITEYNDQSKYFPYTIVGVHKVAKN